jgi:cell division protein FtsQ
VSTKIARGSASRGKPKGKTVRRGGAARTPPPGMLDSLSLPPETVRRVSGWIFLAVLLALALAVAVALRVPQMLGVAVGEAVGGAGFTVQRIESKGLERMNPMQVYRVAQDQLDRAMPLVDLDETRERLLRFGWVKDARVSRRLPDTLVVDIVERTPAAIWQNHQKLMLIDGEGALLEPVKLEAMPDLPLVIGPQANRHLGELSYVLSGAPDLKALIAGATWVGDRRWDLRFQTGEVLALPEGGGEARKALAIFAEKDRRQPLLGGQYAGFDMRIPRRMIVQLKLGPGGTVPAIDDPVPDVESGATTSADTI